MIGGTEDLKKKNLHTCRGRGGKEGGGYDRPDSDPHTKTVSAGRCDFRLGNM